MSQRVCALIMLLAVWPTTVVAQSSYPVPVGSIHPDFVLPNIDGKTNIRLSDYRGKKVLLIHFASW